MEENIQKSIQKEIFSWIFLDGRSCHNPVIRANNIWSSISKKYLGLILERITAEGNCQKYSDTFK